MKNRHSAEQIVLLLREAEVKLGKCEKAPEVCRKLGITQQTYYRCRTLEGITLKTPIRMADVKCHPRVKWFESINGIS